MTSLSLCMGPAFLNGQPPVLLVDLAVVRASALDVFCFELRADFCISKHRSLIRAA
eukprot:CAMPEP_0114268740 /NCGR_PEP_ID=MMETSP0058-20121206/26166_1 /TAXON_ID=36894 /ORGANISM="Pyramimonas parkeae, CCMP726" /LENGTH=55 /DNA_ID=CAMNT_0001387031 /DNA_START=230 /DNA_END=394 /DNA_ORIENTATION=-